MKRSYFYNFKKDHILKHTIELLGPVVGIILLISSLFVFYSSKFLIGLSIIAIELFSPFSVELSGPVGAAGGFDIFSLIFIITLTNLFASLFIIWNFKLLFHIPKLGDYFRKFDKKIETFVKEHDIEKISFFGLFLYFLTPFQASGVFTIAIIGKILHISDKKILFITIFGTIAGLLIFASPIYGIKLLFF